MALLPAGFSLPPLPHLLVLVAGLTLVVTGYLRWRPRTTPRVILGLAAWMITGSALHVLYVVGALPPALAPFAGTPSVYLSVGVLAGGAWLLADRAGGGDVATAVAVSGVAAFLPTAGAALAVGAERGSLTAFWPGVGLLVAGVIGVVGWVVLRRLHPPVAVAGPVGLLTLLGHALDGVSTAVGVDVLGYGERTPLSALVLEFAGSLPTASTLGTGWLFVLVKLLVAGLVVAMLADYVREDPDEGFLVLGFVAAVGLGPGVHNLLLFAVA
jgi:uncharacterized membrane protein